MEWYPAVVAKAGHRWYDLHYDDGDKEGHVTAEYMRPLLIADKDKGVVARVEGV